jgi:MFS family permease
VGLVVALTGGLGNGLVVANLVNLQGTFGAYVTEMQWLPAAYVMTIVSMNLILVKFRQRFGLQLFTELFLALYAIVTFAHLYAHNLPTAIAVRAAHGIVGAALTTLSLFYCIQAFPAKRRLMGLVFGVGLPQLALPLARVISSDLLKIGEWAGLIWFELGMALLALACVLAIKLPPGDRYKVFEKRDFITFLLFAPGVALLCAVLALGRFVWWLEAPWVGACLAGAIALIVAALAVEHHRDNPMLNTRWLISAKITKLALSVLLIRIVLAEATSVVAFFQALGLHTDQMQTMFALVLLGSVLGLVTSALTISRENLDHSLMVALACMAAGALIDAGATSDTRPMEMYLSQFLLGFGGTFFLGPTIVAGFGNVLLEPRNLISFTVMFSMTQNLGSLVGNALTGTFETVREKYHSSYLVEPLSLIDPQVASRLQSGAGALLGAVPDPAARSAQGYASLATAATRQANVLAYNDVFMMIAAIALLTLAWLALGELWTFCQSCRRAPAPPPVSPTPPPPAPPLTASTINRTT